MNSHDGHNNWHNQVEADEKLVQTTTRFLLKKLELKYDYTQNGFSFNCSANIFADGLFVLLLKVKNKPPLYIRQKALFRTHVIIECNTQKM